MLEMDGDRSEQRSKLLTLLGELNLISPDQVQSSPCCQFNLDVLVKTNISLRMTTQHGLTYISQVVLDIEKERATVLVVEELQSAF